MKEAPIDVSLMLQGGPIGVPIKYFSTQYENSSNEVKSKFVAVNKNPPIKTRSFS